MTGVRFLEQLMPGSADGSTKVRAALGPRFAPEPPAGLGREPVVLDEAVEGEGERWDEPRRPSAVRAPLGQVPTPRPAMASNPEAPSAGTRRGAQVEPRRPGPEPRAALEAHHSGITSPAAQDARLAGGSLASRPRASSGLVGQARPNDAQAVDRGVTWVGIPEPVRAPEGGRPPLSARACAERASRSEAERPTVVQVTIDRIDVRAPAAAAPEAPPARKRGGASQSLGDYLRRRDHAGHGAP